MPFFFLKVGPMRQAEARTDPTSGVLNYPRQSIRYWLVKPFLSLASTLQGGRFFVNFLTPVDRWLLQLSSGRWSIAGLGAPTLLLTTLGRRSGKKRSTPLLYLSDPNDPTTLYVIASKGGAPELPDWYLNLRQERRAEILSRSMSGHVIAIVLEGPSRDWIWEAFVRFNSGFATYAARNKREIPVVALTLGNLADTLIYNPSAEGG